MIPPMPYFPWSGTIEVHDDGTIWRIRSRGAPCEPHRIDLHDGAKGYYRVVLPLGGRWRSFPAHHIVWLWNTGEWVPEGLQINHKDLDKSNNRIENLEVVTGPENIRHSYANGRTMPWSRATMYRGKPRIDDHKEAMRAARAQGLTYKEIAEKFNCSTSHAFRLARG